jgi:hypothetical protein
VSRRAQDVEGVRLKSLRRTAPKKSVCVGGALVPVRKLRGLLSTYRNVYSVSSAPVDLPRSGVVVCECGIAKVTRTSSGVDVDVVASWKAPSLLCVNDQTIVVTKQGGVQSGVGGVGLRVSWRALSEAHTPYYSYEALPGVMETHRAYSALCSCRIGPWFAVVRQTFEGFECLRCSASFDTLEKWAAHYPKRVPTSLPWQQLSMSTSKRGELVFTTLRRSMKVRAMPDRTTVSAYGTMNDPSFRETLSKTVHGHLFREILSKKLAVIMGPERKGVAP